MKDSGKEKINKYKAKLARYCAYRERTRHEVTTKARDLGLYHDEAEQLLEWLVAENFVNEERFARTYVRDKFYLNKWGKNKIRQGLAQKFISSQWAEAAMSEIAGEDYSETLYQLMTKKLATVKADQPIARNQKVARYLIGKGYEPELVWQAIKNQ